MVAWKSSSAAEKTCIWWAEPTRSSLEDGDHWRDVTGPEKSRGKSMSLTVCRDSTARMCRDEADSVATNFPLRLGAQWGEAIAGDQRRLAGWLLSDEVCLWSCLDIETHRSPPWWEGGRVRGAVISPWKLSEKRMLTGGWTDCQPD